MPKQVITRAIVHGVGPFPLDMLRYDQMYPATEAETAKIIASLNGDRVKVEIEGKNTATTPARWESFMWHVDKEWQVR